MNRANLKIRTAICVKLCIIAVPMVEKSALGWVSMELWWSSGDYLLSISANKNQVLIGMLLELVNCVAAFGISIMLFQVLKKY
jgi:hypothetical protein